MTILLVLLIFIFMFCGLSSSQECPGPVSFNSSLFTIRGPCPNDTVLVAVGSTIQYRCDYIDRKTGTDLPYWYIPELSDIPFREGEGNSEHGITIVHASSISGEGQTILSIPVEEQHLNNTLGIQCGLCSLSSFSGDGCDKENRLSENITSIPPVKLVAFGHPRNLNSSINSSTGIVSLYWDPPITSADYNCTSEQQQCWIYEVQLINDDDDPQFPRVISFSKTHNNQLKISRLNVTKKFCIIYKWTVTAETMDSSYESEAEGLTMIVLQKVSQVTSSVTYNIMNCSSNITITAIFNVVAIQPLDTLEYFIVLNINMESATLNTTNDVYSFNNHNISIVFSANTVSLSISLPSNLMDNDDSTVVYAEIGVSNECGMNTTDQHEVPFDNVITCPSVPSSINSSTSIDNTTTLNSSILSMSSISPSLSSVLSSSDISSSIFLSISPSITPNDDNTINESISPLVIFIPVSVCVVIIILCIIVLILLCVTVCVKNRSKHIFKVKPGLQLNDTKSNDTTDDDGPYTCTNMERYASIESPTKDEMHIYTQTTTAAVSDYLTPYEATQEYKSTISSSLEAQYCEPAQLLSKSPSSLTGIQLNSSIGRAKGGSIKIEDMEEIPGYCVPPPATNSRNSVKIKNNTLTREHAGKKQPSIPAPDSPPPAPPPMYADISEIHKANKKLAVNSYAMLELSQIDDDNPPPLPPPHVPETTYSTIASPDTV